MVFKVCWYWMEWFAATLCRQITALAALGESGPFPPRAGAVAYELATEDLAANQMPEAGTSMIFRMPSGSSRWTT